MSKKLDFLVIKTKKDKNGIITEVFPDFNLKHNKDILIRSNKFYAVWNEDTGAWSEDEGTIVDIIDRELDDYVKERPELSMASVKKMEDAGSGAMDRYRKYVEKQLRDNNPPWLNMSVYFSNQQPKKEDYISKKLDFPIEDVKTPCWDKFMETLYGPEESHKIEYLIGAIIKGGTKDIQKFWVFYGAPGTGKSTILNIIYDMFREFSTTVTLKDITDGQSQFSLSPFAGNPLVAIDQDADLFHIKDNTRLNMIASHDTLNINEKGKPQYPMRLSAALIAASNSPVNITDASSGIIRRLIDINPTGNKIPKTEYVRMAKQVKFEYGGIAKKCIDVYEANPHYYELYEASSMRRRTDPVYYFMTDMYGELVNSDGAKLNDLYKMYKVSCESNGFTKILNKQDFQVHMEDYFDKFYQKYRCEDGTTKNKYFKGFKKSQFSDDMMHPVLEVPEEQEIPDWLQLSKQPSIFDIMCEDCPAQYANAEGMPKKAWANVTKTLKSLNTSKLHYVRVPENHIVIDLDIKNEKGEKDYALNVSRVISLGLPATYCEVSKSGAGLHLHYIYNDDPSRLCSYFPDNPNVEIKVFRGKSALRRLLTLCNGLAVSSISSGLPIKEDKVVNKDVMTTERGLRTTIKKCLEKEVHSSTKSNVDFISKILNDAINQGITFDVSDMKSECIAFACQSSNNAQYCFDLIQKTPFKSPDVIAQEVFEDMLKPRPIAFFDVEVFPNYFCINWKQFGPQYKVNRMINPSSEEVEMLYSEYDLIGFNCRRYDNHIIYASSMGYSNAELYRLSTRIIGGDKDAFFREAWNLSKTDIYDFASAGNKMSLKKLEIKIKLDKKFLKEHPEYNYVKHHELGLPWDKPVPEELWEKVAEYCDDDVLATEAAFVYLRADYIARQILADLADANENTTTNSLTTKFIFEDNKKPQDEFFYRDMSKPVKVLDMEVREFLEMACPEMMAQLHGPEHSLLPYFPGYKFENGVSTYKGCTAGEGGYVYVEEGMYGDVALLDVASMHPHSLIAECHFGPYYTARFRDIVEGRVSIKHEDWPVVNAMLDGKLAKYVKKVEDGEMRSKDLANALKTAINSVYGLTSASFENPFRDPRNKDNIVAKRGALFMIDLVEAVKERGFTVVHIKTDSIKIADATPEIIKFVMDFGKMYGYTFEHEATYDRMCIVNKSTYIARYATAEKCERLYGYIPGDNAEHPYEWTATGEQFKVPYVFKNLFSNKDIEVSDLCETFEVKKGSLHLDLNANLPDVSMYEKELSKLETKYKKGEISDSSFEPEAIRLRDEIAKGHSYKFVGRIGTFTPVRPGLGGGGLYRIDNNKPYNASGASGYLWMESDMIPDDKFYDYVDFTFYDKLADDAREAIGKYCMFDEFVSDDEYMPGYMKEVLYVPDTDLDELPF